MKTRPVYQGYLFTEAGMELWNVEAHVYSTLEDVKPLRVFEAPIPRDNFNAGVQDAACEAIRGLMGLYEPMFEGTRFEYFPTKYSDDNLVYYSPTTTEDNPKLVQQVDLTRAFNDSLEDDVYEIRRTRKQLRDVQEELDTLKAEMALKKRKFGDA
jgi:hypothetical protein